jgi:hypothetical protein
MDNIDFAMYSNFDTHEESLRPESLNAGDTALTRLAE